MSEESSSRAHILIVDAHVATGLTLKAILERSDYRVWYASNAAQADDLVGMQTFHFAIIDLDVDRSGINFLRVLKAQQPKCKAMILTGYPSQEAAEAALAEGAVSFMTKPCDVEELKRIIRGALQESPAAQPQKPHNQD